MELAGLCSGDILVGGEGNIWGKRKQVENNSDGGRVRGASVCICFRL